MQRLAFPLYQVKGVKLLCFVQNDAGMRNTHLHIVSLIREEIKADR